MKLPKKSVALVIGILCIHALKSQTFYVSAAGSDKNPGTIQKPFQSLEKPS